MADVEKTVLIGYSAERMFDLVTNVKDYPDFLPWCGGVEIYEQSDTSLDARVDIAFKGIHQYFRTLNTQMRPSRIDMTFADGPFKAFTGFWQFTPLRADACKINFHLHYEFSSVILEKLIGPVFSMIANTFVDSFVKRAEAVYGES
ncbi:type II toxin-antitoxin system RatA family toxin [Ralstonia pseudosolanacearum]|uniref:type II toxin-antitoxin system RatA family toxin n=1 Tax=Ralstonia pseudosolanacearum TaxID=1310165 RepID=UPI00035B4C2B|nr:type II toxin-antitoxin system RatA family toxin [Ralstonia pseudosolanacearum]ARS56039.1 ubiquinone-binding protein [Ralstonia solanacearum FJAT-91]QKZ27975.1 type II toxin-antitoxin system RatA family toxin [Ralstonia solanacearum]MCK4145607.1 type II toxin-antitoxin system RatA family toxin [Ralstonia pseudosolanacearum]QKZ32943.1 type II toxin-antitoxin system RatA family toxin [Ralstonia solanacearum]QMT09229.1 type II toxin-antitoxin system RatA family toxin [Ralstonia solanacearum]